MGKPDKLLYGPEDVPPWYLCFFLGVQHFLTCFGSTVSIPLILAPAFCLGDDVTGNLVKSYLISTIFVGSGICTMLQTTFGNRLPILQGGTFTFLIPTFALMGLPHFTCDNVKTLKCTNIHNNVTYPSNFSANYFTANGLNCCQKENKSLCFTDLINNPQNVTLFDDYFLDATNDGGYAVVEFPEVWQRRLREVQGAIISASLIELVVGMTGMIGMILALISPLAIAPVITLVGLSLFQPAFDKAGSNWTISGITIFLIVLFSQYLTSVKVPYPAIKEGRIKMRRYPIFKVFPVLLGLVSTWLLCAILTAAAPESEIWTDPSSVWYHARTDTKLSVIYAAPWFRFVYPFQWGMPTFSVAGTVGLLSGVLASMLESIGDYYAAADISQIPPPPVHAINRGIMMEGVACVIDGMLGSGNGTTTYSENIGTLGITKAASRRMMQTAAAVLIVLGLLSKFAAFFVTMPDPIIGGLYCVMFGLITGVGISNLKYCDLSSSRNVFIFGFSLFAGMGLPYWLGGNADAIATKSAEFNRVFIVLLSTPPFVAGVIAILFDNTIPATRKERGLEAWNSTEKFNSDDFVTYDIPWLRCITDLPFMKYIPISPAFSQKEPEWPKKLFPCTQRVDTDSDDDEIIEDAETANTNNQTNNL